MRRKFVTAWLFAAVAFAVAVDPATADAASDAQTAQPSVTGAWRVDIEHKRGRCRWQGRVDLAQDGDTLTGSGRADPPRRLRWCPRLEGKVKGRVTGQRVRFGFATGRLGTADFDGTLAPTGQTLKGRWRAGSAAGTWRAERTD